MRRKRGKAAKKARQAMTVAEPEDLVKAPHSFVFHRGQVSTNLKNLITDFRKVLEPFTAANLRASEKNSLKDFVSIAGPLNVSHFLMVSSSSSSANMRIMRLARGPTMSFRIVNYTLSKDVISAQKRPNVNTKLFAHHPLLVLNGFGEQNGQPPPNHLKLMATMFQNMFPAININKMRVANVRRCLLIRYDPESEKIYLRHYSIKAVPVGVSRRVRRMIQTRLPDMSGFNDIGDYLLNKGAISSESEGEMDGEHNQIQLPDNMPGRGNMKEHQSAIRLHELGPRLTLQLVKVEEGLCDGRVVYHSFISKSPEELATLESRLKERQKLKETRQKQQKANVAEKKKRREEHKTKCLEGMKSNENDMGVANDEVEEEKDEDLTSDEDDAEYYRNEIGEEPEAGSFSAPGAKRRRKKSASSLEIPKRFKKSKPVGDRQAGKAGRPADGRAGRTVRFAGDARKKNMKKPGFKKYPGRT